MDKPALSHLSAAERHRWWRNHAIVTLHMTGRFSTTRLGWIFELADSAVARIIARGERWLEPATPEIPCALDPGRFSASGSAENRPGDEPKG